MITPELKDKIESLAKEVLEKAGLELIEFKISGQKNDLLIQITADKPSGGISIGECAIINKSLVAAIEQENFLPPEVFSLELSSPGLDRPLVTRRDFMRVKNQELHFWLSEPVAGKREAQGVLIEVGESTLSIDTGKTQLVLPLGLIVQGMLVI